MIAPRNFAAGIINRKEIGEDIDRLSIVFYKIVGHETINPFKTREQVLNWLTLNFEYVIPIYYYPILNEASWNEYHETTFKTFLEAGFGLDGLVLTSDNVLYDIQNKAYIWDEVAFKFDAESVETKVIDIEWTLSRTQRLVPVAVVEPVELSGAIVNRATCNNAQMVMDLGLGRDAEITIQRANEVIPKILEVLNSSTQELPTACPICGEQLQWVGVDLKCVNNNCPNIDLSNLRQWCESIGETDGLQWTLMKQYLDMYNIHTIADLYNKMDYVWTDLTVRPLSITESKIKTFFSKLYLERVPIEKALIALNIPRLGIKTVEVLSTERLLIHSIYMLSVGQYENDEWAKASLLELVKDATTKSILDNIDKFSNLYYLNINDSNTDRIIYKEKKVKQSEVIYVAITGSLITMKRKDFENYIKKYNYELSSNLRKCRFLITNDPTSGSSKNKQAQEYGIPIVTEQQFLESLDLL